LLSRPEEIVVDEVAVHARTEGACVPATDAVAPCRLFSDRHDDVDDVRRLGDWDYRERRSLDGRQPLEMNARFVESGEIQERALELSELAPEHLVVRSRHAAKLDAPDVDSVRRLLRGADRRSELKDQ
jgi:hypothetical protein